ncbi:MAG: MBL fold metallo-hydrolase [Nostocoides sp.]
MQLTHLGHACLLVELADQRILVDPGTIDAQWHGVRDLTAIVITHAHPDHLDIDRLPALVAQSPGVPVIADPGSLAALAGTVEAYPHGGDLASLGSVRITPVGEVHALIHEDVPRIANVGVRFDAEGEPSLYVPGDNLEGEPGQIDVLAFPLTAPWQASRHMVAFLRRIAAPVAVPVHDGVASAAGRAIYLGQAVSLGPDATEVRDLAGAGPRIFER